MQPGTKTGNATIAFNVRIADTHKLHYTQPMIASIGGTHGAFFCKAVESGAPFSHDVIAPGGFLDKEGLVSKHPGLGQALRSGLEYTVVSAHVANLFPKFVQIAQAALNHKSTLEISELEGCMAMHREASRLIVHMGFKESDAWESARKMSLTQEPFWQNYSKSIANFASRCTLEQLEELRDVRAVLFQVPGGVPPEKTHGPDRALEA